MDEEDGRPGPRARQSGRVDVLADAFTSSLCIPTLHLQITHSRDVPLHFLRPGSFQVRISFKEKLL